MRMSCAIWKRADSSLGGKWRADTYIMEYVSLITFYPTIWDIVIPYVWYYNGGGVATEGGCGGLENAYAVE